MDSWKKPDFKNLMLLSLWVLLQARFICVALSYLYSFLKLVVFSRLLSSDGILFQASITLTEKKFFLISVSCYISSRLWGGLRFRAPVDFSNQCSFHSTSRYRYLPGRYRYLPTFLPTLNRVVDPHAIYAHSSPPFLGNAYPDPDADTDPGKKIKMWLQFQNWNKAVTRARSSRRNRRYGSVWSKSSARNLFKKILSFRYLFLGAITSWMQFATVARLYSIYQPTVKLKTLRCIPIHSFGIGRQYWQMTSISESTHSEPVPCIKVCIRIHAYMKQFLDSKVWIRIHA